MPQTVETGIHPSLRALAAPIGRLTSLAHNPNVGDVAAVARSLQAFGQRKPIVVKRTGGPDEAPVGEVIAGNTTLAAATKLGWLEIAAVWTDDDEATAAAFALADNHTADLGKEDADELRYMMQLVAEADMALLAATSYTSNDLKKLLGTDALEEVGGDQSDMLGDEYQVVVTCRDEQHQLELIEHFRAEGTECRALVS